MKKNIALFFFLFSTNFAFAQNCDRIYLLVDSTAYYGQAENKAKSMFDFLDEEIIPVFKNCIDKEKRYPSRLFITLIIDKQGNVREIKNLVINLEENCKQKLSESLLKTKWNPAIFQGQKVCSELHIPFNCLRWE
ncbi:hypothetical protein V9L05_13010 [Bernardetia sp. Wsw4-3y2]|uniref:hypothetical protein n=1 Tax=Bernardetia sp. Wsw4-3y2 TaxID=3127471 RepID=UPI0030CCC7A4